MSGPLQSDSKSGDPSAGAAVKAGSVSVIVPCCGQLEYTRLCVPSLLRSNPPPSEILFLDAGSLDGTLDYLEGVAAAASIPVEVINVTEHPTTPGPEPSFQTRGEYVVLLSNDTIVPERWLEHLVQLVRTNEAIGMVGPMSNAAPPAQFAGELPYRLSLKAVRGTGSLRRAELLRQIDQVSSFARQWREQQRGNWSEENTLGGGCVLLKRAVLQRIGPTLPRAPLGFFDLRDLSCRVVQAGYRLACCRDLFLHHFGSRNPSFREDTQPGTA